MEKGGGVMKDGKGIESNVLGSEGTHTLGTHTHQVGLKLFWSDLE